MWCSWLKRTFMGHVFWKTSPSCEGYRWETKSEVVPILHSGFISVFLVAKHTYFVVCLGFPNMLGNPALSRFRWGDRLKSTISGSTKHSIKVYRTPGERTPGEHGKPTVWLDYMQSPCFEFIKLRLVDLRKHAFPTYCHSTTIHSLVIVTNSTTIPQNCIEWLRYLNLNVVSVSIIPFHFGDPTKQKN